ncbi:MAG: hypothetical protein U1A72_23215 [Sulfuritalea sp.]|nr:hypothetical protein [Sulfuritalea sp.]
MIKVLFALACCALWSGGAFAGAASAAWAGLSKSGSSYSFKSAGATAANGAFFGSASVNAAGKAVTMPASARFAANAASFAMGAVRLNPTMLIGTAVASWLLAEGLQYANNSWNKNVQSGGGGQQEGWSGYEWWGNVSVYRASTSLEAAQQHCRAAYPNGDCVTPTSVYVYGGTYEGREIDYQWNGYQGSHTVRRDNCFDGYSMSNGVCVGQSSVPAQESDFSGVGSHPLPDAAAQELARKDVPIPVEAPVLAPGPVDSFGTPFLDPLSGRQKKELTRLSPDPLPTDPLNVRIDQYDVDAGAVPGQTEAAPAPTTKKEPEPAKLGDIQFPSDYARQGEAATAANSINDTLGPKLDKITETGADPADPTQPEGSQFDQAFFQGTFTSLLAWQLPAHSSQCPTSSFDWEGQTFTMDSHCQLVADHFGALALVMTAVWTLLGLFILLRA